MKITTAHFFFSDISKQLKTEAGVDVIGIGITSNADKEKLDYITGNSTKTIVPKDGEDINNQISDVEKIVQDGMFF